MKLHYTLFYGSLGLNQLLFEFFPNLRFSHCPPSSFNYQIKLFSSKQDSPAHLIYQTSHYFSRQNLQKSVWFLLCIVPPANNQITLDLLQKILTQPVGLTNGPVTRWWLWNKLYSTRVCNRKFDSSVLKPNVTFTKLLSYLLKVSPFSIQGESLKGFNSM